MYGISIIGAQRICYGLTEIEGFQAPRIECRYILQGLVTMDMPISQCHVIPTTKQNIRGHGISCMMQKIQLVHTRKTTMTKQSINASTTPIYARKFLSPT